MGKVTLLNCFIRNLANTEIAVTLSTNMMDEVHLALNETGSGINSAIQSKIPKGAEVTTVLVGAHDKLTSTVSAFVRLDHGCTLGNLAEVQIPVRFLFLLLGPDEENMNYHEVGRSIGTLMSDKIFLESAYEAQVCYGTCNEINTEMPQTQKVLSWSV